MYDLKHSNDLFFNSLGAVLSDLIAFMDVRKDYLPL